VRLQTDMGCWSSKAAASPTAPPIPKPAPAAHPASTEPSSNHQFVAGKDDQALQATHAAVQPEATAAPLSVYIVYYSLYGHVESLARAMAEAINSTGGSMKAKCFQVLDLHNSAELAAWQTGILRTLLTRILWEVGRSYL
jgi:hypothetical protein